MAQALPSDLVNDLQPYFYIQLDESKLSNWVTYLKNDSSVTIDTIINGSEEDSMYFYISCSKNNFISTIQRNASNNLTIRTREKKTNSGKKVFMVLVMTHSFDSTESSRLEIKKIFKMLDKKFNKHFIKTYTHRRVNRKNKSKMNNYYLDLPMPTLSIWRGKFCKNNLYSISFYVHYQLN